jgi:molecular chaperone GrpE (heat shock protein)
MSEFDSRSGSGGRKGFVRDVMRRISSTPGAEEGNEESMEEQTPTRSYRDEIEDLQNALRLFGSDSPEFRRRLERMLAEHEALRRRYQLSREQFVDAERQNERLV